MHQFYSIDGFSVLLDGEATILVDIEVPQLGDELITRKREYAHDRRDFFFESLGFKQIKFTIFSKEKPKADAIPCVVRCDCREFRGNAYYWTSSCDYCLRYVMIVSTVGIATQEYKEKTS